MKPSSQITIAEITAPFPGKLAIAPLPGKTGQISQDLAQIRHWGASLVVSMTQESEMTAAGVEQLPRQLAAIGISHRHFPIQDFDAPAMDDPRWPPLSADIHEALTDGSAVLLHCMGGKGRSGMVAMRLLIEAGIAPEHALATIRAARPGAVETPEQEAWARDALKSSSLA